jgi:hypothetical protein
MDARGAAEQGAFPGRVNPGDAQRLALLQHNIDITEYVGAGIGRGQAPDGKGGFGGFYHEQPW